VAGRQFGDFDHGNRARHRPVVAGSARLLARGAGRLGSIASVSLLLRVRFGLALMALRDSEAAAGVHGAESGPWLIGGQVMEWFHNRGRPHRGVQGGLAVLIHV
jgi:hypothetical protein